MVLSLRGQAVCFKNSSQATQKVHVQKEAELSLFGHHEHDSETAAELPKRFTTSAQSWYSVASVSKFPVKNPTQTVTIMLH